MRLNHRQILVTRPALPGKALCALLVQHGAIAYHVPALDIQPCTSSTTFRLPDIAFFISVHAVQYAPLAAVASSQCYAIGAATVHALKERGIHADRAEHSDSEALLRLPALQSVHGKTIAIFCGVGGRTLLEDELQQRGGECYRCEVYQRQCAIQHAPYLQTLLKTIFFDYVICTSVESVLCLEKMAGPQKTYLYSLSLVVLSQRIAYIAKKRGFKRVFIFTEPFDNLGMVEQLQQWEGGKNE